MSATLAAPERAPHRPFREVWLITAGHTLTHWYPATFFLLLPLIGKELGLTYSQIGLVMTCQFVAGAVAMSGRLLPEVLPHAAPADALRVLGDEVLGLDVGWVPDGAAAKHLGGRVGGPEGGHVPTEAFAEGLQEPRRRLHLRPPVADLGHTDHWPLASHHLRPRPQHGLRLVLDEPVQHLAAHRVPGRQMRRDVRVVEHHRPAIVDQRAHGPRAQPHSAEERREGKEGRSRWSAYH